jgi:hypothetical protein
VFYLPGEWGAKMYSNFTFASVPIKDIALDDKNPRIVSQTPLTKQGEILAYLYENEDLESFVKKIASEGKNFGAERPYVVKKGAGYIVIEGNTRIAAYKLLTGLIKPPSEYAGTIPHISDAARGNLLNVDCTIAQTRDELMPIMAAAHFGMGDKSKWGYLGSRKAIYDEWKAGKNLARLSKLFRVPQGEIKDLILEYQLYLKALGLNWTKSEKDILLRPSVAFNPPVRFLQTSGHKDKMNISYDTTNLKVVFTKDADKKFKHLLKKLVINPVKGLGATATYDAVFADYATAKTKSGSGNTSTTTGTTGSSSSGAATNTGGTSATSGSSSTTSGSTSMKAGALFGYSPKMNNALIKQLMKEAKTINAKAFPAAATFLLRNIVEAILKHIIEDQKANQANLQLDLEKALNLCTSNKVSLASTDVKILSDFRKHHLLYLNLGAHGNLIPSPERVYSARDSIDQFVKKHA